MAPNRIILSYFAHACVLNSQGARSNARSALWQRAGRRAKCLGHATVGRKFAQSPARSTRAQHRQVAILFERRCYLPLLSEVFCMTGVEKHHGSVHILFVASARSTAQRPQRAKRSHIFGVEGGSSGSSVLGRMGTEITANLATAGRRVVAHVGRPKRLSELEVLELTPTTNISDLVFDCRSSWAVVAQRQRPARSCLRAKLKQYTMGSHSD